MTGPEPHRTLSKLTPDQIRIEEQGDKITLTLAPDTAIVLDRAAPDRDLQHDYVHHLACAARIARTLMRRAGS